ncbi:hypothetical protein, partial [Klebsiella pneumoniae]|uniref:hypothetical protein n=1 Tax=Klebsiella pneumoniae TaxID=573 RepID=UPI0027302DEA
RGTGHARLATSSHWPLESTEIRAVAQAGCCSLSGLHDACRARGGIGHRTAGVACNLAQLGRPYADHGLVGLEGSIS